jgi:FixJ family two-component response regulator
MNTYSAWVAVIDDEEAIRRALLRLMRSAGIAARSFAGGGAFLASLQAGQPCCVVLDLHMPGVSGFDVLDSLARHAPQIRVIVVTGQHSAQTQARAAAYRPLAYLLKPMNDQALLDAIGPALARAQADSASARA